MRYVDRPEDEMIDAQEELDRTQKYNCETVKSYLTRAYKGICAYCEAEVSVANYMEVEHFHPKSQYDTYKLHIKNLHLACKRCNNPKGSQTIKILSPNYYKDNPENEDSDWKLYTPEELKSKIQYCGHRLYSPTNDQCAIDTIDILRLNNDRKDDKREFLIESRLKIFYIAFNNIIGITNSIRNMIKYRPDYSWEIEEFNKNHMEAIQPQVDNLREMMEHGAPYSQMIIDNFKKTLYELLKIVEYVSGYEGHISFKNKLLTKIDEVAEKIKNIEVICGKLGTTTIKS